MQGHPCLRGGLLSKSACKITCMVNSSLRALLTQIIDYAGLFPPATLPLDQAIRNYARYRGEAEAWMLGRFICPAAQLGQLVSIGKELFNTPEPFRFSVLGRGGKEAKEFFDNVRADLADVARFRETFGERVAIDAYEVKLPDSAFNPIKPNQLSSLVGTVAYLIETSGPPATAPVFESPLTDRTAHLAVIQALHDDGQTLEARNRRRFGRLSYKLRCGGLEAAAFPPAELVALVVCACRTAGVPFKATAGLHHPLRRFDAGVQTHMHGFVNLFAGAALAARHGLGEKDVVALLLDEDARNWSRPENKLRWKNLEASSSDIEAARRDLALSFGSCSFDEPRDDLRQLGWIA
jgi:hypothetical protein